MKILKYSLEGGYQSINIINTTFELSDGHKVTIGYNTESDIDGDFDKKLIRINEEHELEQPETKPDLSKLKALATICFNPDFKINVSIDCETWFIEYNGARYTPLDTVPAELKPVTDIILTDEVKLNFSIKKMRG